MLSNCCKLSSHRLHGLQCSEFYADVLTERLLVQRMFCKKRLKDFGCHHATMLIHGREARTSIHPGGC